jgi:hypothetical protein
MKRMLALLLAAALPAGAQERKPDKAPVATPSAPSADRAIARGVAYLRTLQKEDGSISQAGFPVAMTSLSIIAMVAAGHQPTDPTPEGKCLGKALAYVLRPGVQDAQGYFNGDGGNMYGHAIITLMLAELLGMGLNAEQDKVMRERVQKAVALIVRAQKVPRKDPMDQGGWRYNPNSVDSDLSVTIWQVMALRSAQNAWIEVPPDTIGWAIRYIKNCFRFAIPGKGPPKGGTFGYDRTPDGWVLRPDAEQSYAMSSAGLLGLQMGGSYGDPQVGQVADWLRYYKPDPKVDKFFYYGTYYFAQALYQRGEEHAVEAKESVEKLLLPLQAPDGSWKQEQHYTQLNTCFAILSLSVHNCYLPIYQR